MFDISFAELLLVTVVAVVVIGPERLPETVRALALWLGRLRRMASRLYREVEKEVGLEDIRRQLHNEEILRDLEEGERRKTDDTGKSDSGDQSGAGGGKRGS